MNLVSRYFSTLAKGATVQHKGRYLEVLSCLHIQKGEGQGTHIEFIDLQTFKRGKLHAKKGEEFPTVDLTHFEVELVEVTASHARVADRSYQQIDIPINLAPWTRAVAQGTQLQLLMEGDNFVRLSPPCDLKFVKSR